MGRDPKGTAESNRQEKTIPRHQEGSPSTQAAFAQAGVEGTIVSEGTAEAVSDEVPPSDPEGASGSGVLQGHALGTHTGVEPTGPATVELGTDPGKRC
eukprot:9882555-Heterocapsa_arctica.AAC.1